MEIPIWIKKTKFQCDVTKEEFSYEDLHVAWYDRTETKGVITQTFYDKFMLVKQSEGFKLTPRWIGNSSLSARKLTDVYAGNIVVFFTSFLVVDSLHDSGSYEKVTELNSWNNLFRRLTIPYYEKARHRIQEAKQIDDFLECTESQLLSPEVLRLFVKKVYGTDQL